MNLTLRQIRAFVLVARSGSFTGAAKSMHLTQSALSQLIRELETSLNTRLVDRTTRSVSLTAPGNEFLASAQRILDDLEQAVGNVDKLVAKQRGRVVVSLPVVLGSNLPPVLAKFRRAYPGIELALRTRFLTKCCHRGGRVRQIWQSERSSGLSRIFSDASCSRKPWSRSFLHLILSRDPSD
jgi:DNA-binding transcriptional LysR family regulator